MNLKKFDFVKENKMGGVFSCVKTNPSLLKEAKKRGFYNINNPYCNLFSELFFNGGTLNWKKDIDETFKSNVAKYLKSLMASFEPKHEDKEAVCAMLLSELVDIKEDN